MQQVSSSLAAPKAGMEIYEWRGATNIGLAAKGGFAGWRVLGFTRGWVNIEEVSHGVTH